MDLKVESDLFIYIMCSYIVLLQFISLPSSQIQLKRSVQKLPLYGTFSQSRYKKPDPFQYHITFLFQIITRCTNSSCSQIYCIFFLHTQPSPILKVFYKLGKQTILMQNSQQQHQDPQGKLDKQAGMHIMHNSEPLSLQEGSERREGWILNLDYYMMRV